jgi:hypothetical protein
MESVPIQGLAAAYLLFELTKFLVTHLMQKQRIPGFGDQERFQLNEMYNAVQENQKETLDILKEIAHSQRETAKIMERILTKM